tara:strand:- start:2084 stop:2380 length:297 start_codon:yes stop_codon:yes gene_type:complete
MKSNNQVSDQLKDKSDNQKSPQSQNTIEIPAYSSASSQIITEYGKQNMFATQVQPQLVENYSSYPEEAEKTNGRWAMVGIIALIGSYIFTGQIIPGIF